MYLRCDVSDELVVFCLLPHLLPLSLHQIFCETTTTSFGALRLGTSNPCYPRNPLKQTFISRRMPPTVHLELSELAQVPPAPSHFSCETTPIGLETLKLGANSPSYPKSLLEDINMFRRLPLTFRVELSKIDPLPPTFLTIASIRASSLKDTLSAPEKCQGGRLCKNLGEQAPE